MLTFQREASRDLLAARLYALRLRASGELGHSACFWVCHIDTAPAMFGFRVRTEAFSVQINVPG